MIGSLTREDVERVLAEALAGPEWIVSKDTIGWSGTSYVARRGEDEVFIKFGVHAAVVERIGELGIAPSVIATGTHAGQPFVIQQFVRGSYPDRPWFSEHVEKLAALVRTYQLDAALKSIVEYQGPARTGRLAGRSCE